MGCFPLDTLPHERKVSGLPDVFVSRLPGCEDLYMRPPLAVWGSVCGAIALAMVLRYSVVEPAAIAHLCEGPEAPGWCVARSLLVQSFHTGLLPALAVVLAAIAVVWRRLPLAVAAACLGGASLVLYGQEAGVFALVVGLLVAARPSGNADRQGAGGA